MDSEPEMSTGSCAYCVTRFSVVATHEVTKDRTRQMADGSKRTWSGVAARTFYSGGAKVRVPRATATPAPKTMPIWRLGTCPDSGSTDPNDTGLPIREPLFRCPSVPSPDNTSAVIPACAISVVAGAGFAECYTQANALWIDLIP
jgi:hypothetical protein